MHAALRSLWTSIFQEIGFEWMEREALAECISLRKLWGTGFIDSRTVRRCTSVSSAGRDQLHDQLDEGDLRRMADGGQRQTAIGLESSPMESWRTRRWGWN